MDREDAGLPRWDINNGRKIETLENSKIAERVRGWKISHPDSHNKSECARDLGLTRPTVRKWWNIISSEGLADKIQKAMDAMEPIDVRYQTVLTADEMMSAMTNPDDPNYNKILRKTID